MFFNKHRDKLHLQTKSANSIRWRWKFVIGTLIGSGAGLFILSMWTSASIHDRFPCNESSGPNPAVQFHGRMADVVSDSEQKSTADCRSNNCKTVSCSSISGSLNPGQLASDYLGTEFLAQCPHSDTIELLEFQSCTFPNNQLGVDWLTTDLPIEKLTFRDCPLEDFPKGSFASSIFANLRVLTVAKANIRILRKYTFDELKNLMKLSFEDNAIHEAEANLLSSVAESLEILELDDCLSDVNVLANITSLVVLPKLTILSAQRNYLDRINGGIFKSIPNIVSMYLGQSRIATMDVDALKYTRSLALLDLKNNVLTTIAAGTLTPVLAGRPDFKLSIAGNPWDCICEFSWIKDLIRNNPGLMTEIPKCETPERNALLFFTSADFCDDSRPDSTTAQSPITSTSFVKTTRNNETSEDEETVPNYVEFTCRNFERLGTTRSTRKLLSTKEWKFPTRFHEFHVRVLENGDVLVNLSETEDPKVSLIWFKNIEIGGSNDSDRIDCVTNVSESFVLKNLSSDSSYTICLLDNLAELPSPLNCLAARTRAGYGLVTDEVWLTNDDKSVVIPIGISLFVVVSLLSAVSSYWLVRRNPSLLRGSKRIVMVKKRGVDALVMPKGTNWSSSSKDEWTGRIANDNTRWSNERCLKKNSNGSHPNPLENPEAPIDRERSSPPTVARRKDSKVSRVSSLYGGGSYISAIEATPSELYNWRHTARMKSYYSVCLENDEFDETPPIPPLPPHRSIDPPIPSVSLALQSDKRPDTCHQIYNDQGMS